MEILVVLFVPLTLTSPAFNYYTRQLEIKNQDVTLIWTVSIQKCQMNMKIVARSKKKE